jgi:hypothetical protein
MKTELTENGSFFDDVKIYTGLYLEFLSSGIGTERREICYCKCQCKRSRERGGLLTLRNV